MTGSPDEGAERLVVLSGDPSFIQVLERLAYPHEVLAATREPDLARTMMSAPAALVVLDSAAVTRFPLDRLTTRLKLQFPQSVIIVIGTGSDQVALADQVARGTIYQFLLRPVSATRLKPLIDAAWQRNEPDSGEPLADLGDGGGASKMRLWLIAATVGVLVVGGALTTRWLMKRPASHPAAALSAPAGTDNALEDLLARADAALSAGAFENAADLYREAQRASPGDRRVGQGLSRVVLRVIGAAKMQLDQRHVERAQALVREAMALEPDNPEVAELVARLGGAQTQPAAPVASGAPAAPAAPVAAAPAPSPADARLKARLAQLLHHAGELMDQGRLVGGDDSAREVLRQARDISPNDPRVRSAQRQLLDQLLAAARRTLAAGHPEDADPFIQGAQELGARPDEIDDLMRHAQRDIAAAHNDALGRVVTLFNERLQQGRILDPANDSAKYYLGQLTRTDPASPATQIARMAIGARVLAEAQGALRHQDLAQAKRWLAEAREDGVDAASIASIEADLKAAQPPPAPAKAPAAPLPLVKIRNVDAAYPQSALSRGTKGIVELRFIVRQDGRPDDISVISAQPPGTFDRAAISAVSQWRYRPPVLSDGTPTQIQQQVIMRFSP